MRRLAWWCAGFCGAVLVFALGAAPRAALYAAVGLALLGTVLLVVRRGWSYRLAALLLGACLGLGWSAWDYQRNVQPLEPWDGARVVLTARALRASRSTSQGTATDVELSLDGRRYDAVLYSELTLHPGELVTAPAFLRRTGVKLGDDDIYYGARGRDLRVYTTGEAAVTPAQEGDWRLLPARLAERIKDELRLLLPSAECGYETALLSGDRTGLDDGFYEDLALSGTRHIVAVSGMHISILIGALLLLLGSRRLAAFIGLPIVWLFALMVGMEHSVVRAAVMLTVALLAPLFGRQNDAPTTVFFALTLILLQNPRAILDVGLQLSFVSVAGILLFPQRIFDGLWRLLRCERLPGGLRSPVRTVLSGAAAAVAVIPLTLPLSLVYFDLFSLVSPLSGALIVPVIPACFSLGLLAALGGMLWLPLGQLLALPLLWLIRYCMAMTRLLASIPYAALSSRSGYLLLFLVGLYAIVTLCILRRQPFQKRYPALCLLALFVLCLGLGASEGTRAVLTAAMLDVGQGQCVVLTSGGATAIYDCGGSKSPAETAVQYLQSQGRYRVDFLVLSHYDEDHAGGVARLLERVPVGTVFLPPVADDGDARAEILETAAACGCAVQLVEADMTLSFGDAEADLYAPVSEGSSNEACVAARWHAGDFDVLLTGDMDVTAEKRLVHLHDLSDIEVLAAGHHGSATSTGTAILNLTTPEIVLISVGEGNSYGHPAPETLERLIEHGAAVYRTDQCGTITVRR